MFVCVCKGITESSVQRVGESGVIEPDALVAVFGLDDDTLCCGQCREEIDEFVTHARVGHARRVELIQVLGTELNSPRTMVG